VLKLRLNPLGKLGGQFDENPVGAKMLNLHSVTVCVQVFSEIPLARMQYFFI
jgi:hypothetical protein